MELRRMIKEGKLFGLVNIIDFGVGSFIILAFLGLFLFKSGKLATSANGLKKEGNIEFDVVVKGLRLSKKESIFNQGDKTFITIRNVPYTSLQIAKVQMTNYKTVIVDPDNPSKAISVSDPSEPYTYNYLITLKDKALITDDGPVIGGNKIKIGLPVTLEAFKYRVNASVSDVRIVQ